MRFPAARTEHLRAHRPVRIVARVDHADAEAVNRFAEGQGRGIRVAAREARARTGIDRTPDMPYTELSVLRLGQRVSI